MCSRILCGSPIGSLPNVVCKFWDTHYYIFHEPIIWLATVGDCQLLCELRLLVVCLVGGTPFEPLGTIHERVLLWKALDAFMLVAAWSGVTKTVVIPIEAHIEPLFLLLRIKAFDVFVGWMLTFSEWAFCRFMIEGAAVGTALRLSGSHSEALAEKGGVNS